MKEKHMVISTYNCDPGYLIDLGIPYTIYDQSDQEIFAKKISNLAMQVGSQDYVKTPIFKKRENPKKVDCDATTTPKPTPSK
jgi:hypothetical protein